MNVDAIVARLALQCPTFAQVVAADQSGNPPMQASQAALWSLLSPLVGGRMYPIMATEGGEYPEIVYQLVSSSPTTVGGYEITRTDQYAVAVMSKDYDALIALQAQILTALDGQNIAITNAAHDYFEPEQLYSLNLELEYSFLAAANQATPAAFVYPAGRSASESAFDNYTRQLVRSDFDIVIVTDAGNLTALQDEIQGALLGWQQSANHHEFEYRSGSSVDAVGGLVIWRESYGDAHYISQS